MILDGADNFETRYLVNVFAVRHSIPWVYGAAVGSYGLVMPVLPSQTACLRCVYPDPPSGAQPTCETAGVLNPITSAVASLQTAEALKILAGRADRVSRRITTIDVWSGVIRQVNQPSPRPDCPCCGLRQFVYLDGARRAPISLCGRNAVQIHERPRPVDWTICAGGWSRWARSAPTSSPCALPAALRDDRLPRRPGDHQGHAGHRPGPRPVCQVRGELKRQPPDAG